MSTVELDAEEFRFRAQHCQDESQIDALCWEWLRLAAQDNGLEGQIGIELMQIIKRRCMP